MRKSALEERPYWALYSQNSTEPTKIITRPGPVDPDSLTVPDNLKQVLVDRLITAIEAQKELEFRLSDADNIIKSMENALAIKDEQLKTFGEGLALMKIKMAKSTPVPHIVYIAGSSAAFAFFATSFFVWASKGLLIIEPYYSLTGMIGTITLFGTAVNAIKYWGRRVIG